MFFFPNMFLQLLAYTFRRYTERQLLARLADLTGEQYLKESKTKKIELTLEPDVGLVSCLLAKQMNECVCAACGVAMWHAVRLFPLHSSVYLQGDSRHISRPS